MSDWIAARNARLGREGRTLAPGYYLFRHGEASCYQTGQFDAKVDQVSLGMGVITSVIGLISRDASIVEMGAALANAHAAARVISAFADAFVTAVRRRRRTRTADAEAGRTTRWPERTTCSAVA